MEKVIEIAKNVAIVILALIVAFILFIGLGKLASFAFSSLASAGASLTSVFVPATSTPAVVGPGYAPQPGAGGAYSTSSATMTVTSQPAQTGSYQAPTTAAAPATAYSYSYVSPAHPIAPIVTYYGLPDLKATVVSTGIVNSAGVFVPQSVVYEGQRAAAVILVTNVGTNVSGPWIIQAPLPTNEGGEVFTSVPQTSLTPGSSTKLTLAFNDLRDVSVSSMVVTVDPYNQIAESNKSNNQVVVTFQKSLANGYDSGYSTGYTYPTTYTTNVSQDSDVYYSNGSYYIAPTNTNNNYCTYPYTTYNNGYGYTNSNCNGNGYGLPDLTMSIVSVNNNATSYNSSGEYGICTTNYSYWNGYTGSNCNGNGTTGNTVSAEVQITNQGQSTASNYMFDAGINGSTQYTSPSEPALAPGQTATYAVTLTSPYYASGQNTITATVNPNDAIQESNYSNNTVTRNF